MTMGNDDILQIIIIIRGKKKRSLENVGKLEALKSFTRKIK
jgi:hypothetical protein